MLSVSCTTRAPRPGEVDGREYLFISDRQFQELVEEDAFLEWAEIYGHRSGTLWGPVAERLEQGRDVVLEIDVQGAATVRSKRPEAVLIFLAPPSVEELRRRLRERNTESEAQIARRQAPIEEEMEAASWFDHVVVNDDVDRASSQVAAILDAEAGRRTQL